MTEWINSTTTSQRRRGQEVLNDVRPLPLAPVLSWGMIGWAIQREREREIEGVRVRERERGREQSRYGWRGRMKG